MILRPERSLAGVDEGIAPRIALSEIVHKLSQPERGA